LTGFFAVPAVGFGCLWRWGLVDLVACAALVICVFYGGGLFLELALWYLLHLIFLAFP
jgi:hypothetical protein